MDKALNSDSGKHLFILIRTSHLYFVRSNVSFGPAGAIVRNVAGVGCCT